MEFEEGGVTRMEIRDIKEWINLQLTEAGSSQSKVINDLVAKE